MMHKIAVATGLSQGMNFEPSVPIQAEFEKECPIIAELIRKCGNKCPIFARPLLSKIINLCKAPFENLTEAPTIPAAPSAQEFWQEGHCYPFWPRLRQAYLYSSYFSDIPTSAEGIITHIW